LRRLGPQTLKGIATPLHAFEVCADRDVQSRVEAAAFSGLTPLVGRTHEIGVLLHRWEQATQGSGQIVQAVGEPGIGKSRLVQELKERLAGTPYRGLEACGSPHAEHSALLPMITLLQRATGWQPGEEPAARFARLVRVAGPYLTERPEAIPLLAALLALPIPAEYPPVELDPLRAKQQTLEAIANWIMGLAGEQPVLLLIEDVHWFDPSSFEFLALLLPRVPAARLLVLLLYRPTFQPPWAALPHLTTLPLQRLAPEQVTAMIELVTAGRSLPRTVVTDICAKADGVPLYVEELTKMLLESGQLVEHDGRLEVSSAGGALAIPVTLQESLAARLDRLAPVKEVLQLGAALGRSFTYEQLRAVALLDDVSLNMELGRLVEADILHVHGVPPDATYVFKHALIQDAAYDSLVSNRRREYHQRIAAALTERFPDICDTEPELIARHWERAGNARRRRLSAARRGARDRALGLRRGGTPPGARPHVVRVAPAQRPPTAARARAPAGARRRAGGGPRVRRPRSGGGLHARPRAVPGDRRDRRGALHRAQRTAALPSIARRVDPLSSTSPTSGWRSPSAWRCRPDDASLREPRHARLLAGRLPAVLGHLEQSVARWTRERDRDLARTYGTLSAVVCETYAGQALWFLGFPDQAVTRADAAVQQARAFGHANSLALAMSFATTLRLLRGEAARTQEIAEELIAYATEQQLPFWLGSGTISRGWALAAQGASTRASKNSGRHRPIPGDGRAHRRSVLHRHLGAYLSRGRPHRAGRGHSSAARCFVLESCEDRFFDAELLRVRGEVSACRSPTDSAAGRNVIQ
jgi:hypothetical protein